MGELKRKLSDIENKNYFFNINNFNWQIEKIITDILEIRYLANEQNLLAVNFTFYPADSIAPAVYMITPVKSCTFSVCSSVYLKLYLQTWSEVFINVHFKCGTNFFFIFLYYAVVKQNIYKSSRISHT